MYIKTLDSNLHIDLLLYVDDILIACKEKAEIEALKKLLNIAFDMKDLGRAKKILGLKSSETEGRG